MAACAARGPAGRRARRWRWLLKRSDDKWFVVVVTANARDGVVDEAKSASLASGVVELLGAEK